MVVPESLNIKAAVELVLLSSDLLLVIVALNNTSNSTLTLPVTNALECLSFEFLPNLLFCDSLLSQVICNFRQLLIQSKV